MAPAVHLSDPRYAALVTLQMPAAGVKTHHKTESILQRKKKNCTIDEGKKSWEPWLINRTSSCSLNWDLSLQQTLRKKIKNIENHVLTLIFV